MLMMCSDHSTNFSCLLFIDFTSANTIRCHQIIRRFPHLSFPHYSFTGYTASSVTCSQCGHYNILNHHHQLEPPQGVFWAPSPFPFLFLNNNNSVLDYRDSVWLWQIQKKLVINQPTIPSASIKKLLRCSRASNIMDTAGTINKVLSNTPWHPQTLPTKTVCHAQKSTFCCPCLPLLLYKNIIQAILLYWSSCFYTMPTASNRNKSHTSQTVTLKWLTFSHPNFLFFYYSFFSVLCMPCIQTYQYTNSIQT